MSVKSEIDVDVFGSERFLMPLGDDPAPLHYTAANAQYVENLRLREQRLRSAACDAHRARITGEDSRRVYLTGLPANIEERHVKALVSPFGEIETIEMPQVGCPAALILFESPEEAASCILGMKKFKLGRELLRVGSVTRTWQPCRAAPLYAVLTLAAERTHLEAQGKQISVLENLREKLSDRPEITEPMLKQAVRPIPAVYVGNWPKHMGADEVRSVFKFFGHIINVRMVYEADDAEQHRGFGFIDYACEAFSRAAIEGLNEEEVGGQKIRVQDGQATADPAIMEARAIWLSENPEHLEVEEQKEEQVSVKEEGEIQTSPTPEPSYPTTPTHLLVLSNLLAPAEVDEYVLEDIEEECAKYGTIKASHLHISDTVTALVMFDTTESVDKAIPIFDGRKFGTHTVAARRGWEEKFVSKNYGEC